MSDQFTDNVGWAAVALLTVHIATSAAALCAHSVLTQTIHIATSAACHGLVAAYMLATRTDAYAAVIYAVFAGMEVAVSVACIRHAATRARYRTIRNDTPDIAEPKQEGYKRTEALSTFKEIVVPALWAAHVARGTSGDVGPNPDSVEMHELFSHTSAFMLFIRTITQDKRGIERGELVKNAKTALTRSTTSTLGKAVAMAVVNVVDTELAGSRSMTGAEKAFFSEKVRWFSSVLTPHCPVGDEV